MDAHSSVKDEVSQAPPPPPPPAPPPPPPPDWRIAEKLEALIKRLGGKDDAQSEGKRYLQYYRAILTAFSNFTIGRRKSSKRPKSSKRKSSGYRVRKLSLLFDEKLCPVHYSIRYLPSLKLNYCKISFGLT